MIFNDTSIYGFDISLYQDNNATPQGVDFLKMKASGADFVIVRAGQSTWIDPDFATNWANAKVAGIPRASYWYYDPRVNPVIQAKLFNQLFANDKPEGRLWIDLEFPASWGGNYGNQASWVAFCEELKFNNHRVGIYTGYYWWLEHTTAADREYYAQYPLWLAWYTSNPSLVKIPAPWAQCLIWQDGTPAIGLSVGVESIEIDHNKFNGGAAEFEKEFGAQVTPPTGGTTMNGTAKTLATKVKLWSAKQGTETGGYLDANTQFEFTEQSGTWLKQPNGTWVNCGSTFQYAKVLTSPSVITPPPVVQPVTITHTVTVDGTGRISVDGGAYI